MVKRNRGSSNDAMRKTMEDEICIGLRIKYPHGVPERHVWAELSTGALVWAPGAGPRGYHQCRRVGAGADWIHTNTAFSISSLQVTPHPWHGSSLRWTTWSSRSTISSHKIRKTEILDMGPDTVQNYLLTNKYFAQQSKTNHVIETGKNKGILLKGAEENTK